MATHTFDLFFLTSEPGDMPHRPISHVYVKSWSGNDYGGKGKGKILIGAECVSQREIEHEINQLKRDLDDIKKKAISKYAAAKRAGRG